MIKNFIKTWLSKQGFIKADKLPRWFLDTSEAEAWELPDPSLYSNQAKLYRNLSYVGTVVDIIADACIDADFDIVDKDDKENDEHPLIKLLDKPNPFDSKTEFLRAHFAWRKISGNSYWYLNRASENVPPDDIWLLPPNMINPVPDGRMGLRGYKYSPGNGAEIALEPYEVLHFKSFNPFSRYVGLSAFQSLAVIGYGAIAAQEWNTRQFADNNARLPGILAFAEMVQDTDWQLMKKEVQEASKKKNNMMLRGVGKGGVEWMQSAATQKEMEFLAGLDMNKKDIYERLAPGLYSMLDNNSLANGATGATAFARYTLQPLLRELTDKLNKDLLPLYGDGWEAEYEDVVPEDKTIHMAEIEQFSKFHTVDEVRVEMFGNDPDPDPERGKLFVVQVTTKAEPAPVAPEMVAGEPAPMPDDEMKAAKGGAGSGNFGHEGRPGEVGGSGSGGGVDKQIGTIARVGSGEGETPIYELQNTKGIADEYNTIVVGLKGEERGKVIATTAWANHGSMLSKAGLGYDETPYVRYKRDPNTGVMNVYTSYAGEVFDVDKALDNIYWANDILVAKGLDKSTPLNIYTTGKTPMVTTYKANINIFPEDDTVTKLMKHDLANWKRKATKNIGNLEKMTAFVSDYIPNEIAVTIKDSLASCKTEADIARAFVVDVKPTDSIRALADSINAAVESVRVNGHA